MPGRRPKPTALRLLQGNAGKRPLNKREPKPKVGIPDAPDHLSEKARAAWEQVAPRLAKMGVLTVADGTGLELLVEAYADWLACLADVRTHGRTYESVSEHGVMVRAHPSVAQASEAWKRVRLALGEFGLTPSSRARLKTGGEDTPEDPLEELLNRGR